MCISCTNTCIFNSINNYDNNLTLLSNVNHTFNNYKYSLFIPILSSLINFITPFINLDILSKCSNNTIEKFDYLYTNIIGPQNVFINKNIKVSNIHFLINAKNKEIIYNIISSGNNINIICIFKKGIIKNKKKFKNCLKSAYYSLINT